MTFPGDPVSPQPLRGFQRLDAFSRFGIRPVLQKGERVAQLETQVKAGVTGRCEGAQRAFWDAGLVFSESAGLLLSSRPFGHLDCYLPAGYGTF